MLLVSLVLLSMSHAWAKSRRRKGKGAGHSSLTNRKRECETEVCASVHEDDRPNCILRCQSQHCYAEVYLPEELEPGEIDMRRQRTFQTCLSTEQRKNIAARQ